MKTYTHDVSLSRNILRLCAWIYGWVSVCVYVCEKYTTLCNIWIAQHILFESTFWIEMQWANERANIVHLCINWHNSVEIRVRHMNLIEIISMHYIHSLQAPNVHLDIYFKGKITLKKWSRWCRSWCNFAFFRSCNYLTNRLFLDTQFYHHCHLQFHYHFIA